MRNVKRRQNKRLPPKKKPEKEWCSGGYTAPWPSYARVVKSLEAGRRETGRIIDKIIESDVHLRDELSLAHRTKGKIRCLVCGRRLTAKLLYRGYFDREFTTAVVPAHFAK